jgi:hypothetical protein
MPFLTENLNTWYVLKSILHVYFRVITCKIYSVIAGPFRTDVLYQLKKTYFLSWCTLPSRRLLFEPNLNISIPITYTNGWILQYWELGKYSACKIKGSSTSPTSPAPVKPITQSMNNSQSWFAFKSAFLLCKWCKLPLYVSIHIMEFCHLTNGSLKIYNKLKPNTFWQRNLVFFDSTHSSVK